MVKGVSEQVQTLAQTFQAWNAAETTKTDDKAGFFAKTFAGIRSSFLAAKAKRQIADLNAAKIDPGATAQEAFNLGDLLSKALSTTELTATGKLSARFLEFQRTVQAHVEGFGKKEPAGRALQLGFRRGKEALEARAQEANTLTPETLWARADFNTKFQELEWLARELKDAGLEDSATEVHALLAPVRARLQETERDWNALANTIGVLRAGVGEEGLRAAFGQWVEANRAGLQEVTHLNFPGNETLEGAELRAFIGGLSPELRDRNVVWEAIAQQAGIAIPNDQAFGAWIEANRGALAQLHSLNLQARGLETLPPEIGHLTGLTTLVLRQNQLTSLPPEIGQLENLLMLDLDNNPIRQLPLQIQDLDKLIGLHIEGTGLLDLLQPPFQGQAHPYLVAQNRQPILIQLSSDRGPGG